MPEMRILPTREVAHELSLKINAGYICDGCDHEIAVTAAEIEQLIEHCAFDHASRAGIIAVRYDEQFSGYELGFRLGLDALTEHEQKWRDRGRRY